MKNPFSLKGKTTGQTPNNFTIIKYPNKKLKFHYYKWKKIHNLLLLLKLKFLKRFIWLKIRVIFMVLKTRTAKELKKWIFLFFLFFGSWLFFLYQFQVLIPIQLIKSVWSDSVFKTVIISIAHSVSIQQPKSWFEVAIIHVCNNHYP